MDKFLDVVKINFDSSVERYFESVEVESVKMSKTQNTLNFYLVSSNTIPYNYIKAVKKYMAETMFGVENIKPINLSIKYNLSDKYTARVLYEEIRKDIFEELKDKNALYTAFFRKDNVEFIDDSTMKITFVTSKEFKDVQSQVVNEVRNLFLNIYNKDINIIINYVDYTDTVKSQTFDSNVSENADTSVKEENENKATDNQNENVYKTKSGSRNKRNSVHIEGDILYGKPVKIKTKFLGIADIVRDEDNIETKGIIYDVRLNRREEKGFTIYTTYIYDGEGCIAIKFFGNIEDEETFKLRFRIGREIRVVGSAKYDTFAKAIVIGPFGISLIEKVNDREVIEFGSAGEDDYHNIIITQRVDEELEKRVELHLHTKSSMQDAVGEVKAYIDTATKFGMKAMAITDHGCVNALADAYAYLSNKKRPRANQKFKLIYGVEGYLVDDFKNYYVDSENNFSKRSHEINKDFVIYELATTGENRKNDDIIKISAVKISDFTVKDHFSEFVSTTKPITLDIKDATGVKESDTTNAKKLKDVLNDFIEFSKDSVLVTSNLNMNWMLQDILKENGIDYKVDILDLTVISRLVLKNLKKGELVSIAKELKIKYQGITDRKKNELKKGLTPDEKITLEELIFVNIFRKLQTEYNINNLSELKDKLVAEDDFIKRQPYYHIIILAKNDVGRVNLYKLVSESSVKYMYNKRPRMPRSLINKYREGLIIGSACIIGEFMDAIRYGASDEHLKNIASYYDYLEVQPILNNSFLLKEDKDNFKSIKDLEDLNKKVVEIGEALNKPVVATCDCHYIEKSDKIFRTILRYGSVFKQTNKDAKGDLKEEVSEGLESSDREELYFRTTKEMLDEFSYLGLDKAKEIVVTNTNKISDMIEDICPLRKDKCPPHIQGSDDELKTVCYDRYKEVFGDNEVEEVKNRLDNEIEYIIKNGYSVMYIAAKKLIDFSMENGYPVGSRGSVGSSLAATFLGVSEVNPLKPYYICPRCHHVEYNTDETKKYENESGFDMPDKMCPKCNTKMIKDGVNIPFETFLGIPGDEKAQKEPDIDLNFCSEYQSNIHKKTIEMFGAGNTFKAGTVGTVAAKTAFGYVSSFAKNENKKYSKEQMNYYVTQILDCKNNTSQHPGGMVVVPSGEDINTFTPIQIASDRKSKGITTHFDYHKIDKNLLKLDLLGHDSPLILKKLGELTGTNFLEVPFYEKEVLKLFESTESLGIKPSDISGTRLGCLTIPEFGTDFAMNMCEEAKPRTVADLIRIAGLAHGTNVWQGNVQELIKNGDCTLSSAICCRDDIMIYLIDKGIDKGLSFNIMESVRKGKGLTVEWIDEMKAKGVPDWYIECCQKIQYMFPKAHAAAYVLASLRIAYYKVHYPLEYYATYFSVKKKGLNYKLMMQSKEDITYGIAKIKKLLNEKNNIDKEVSDNIEETDGETDQYEKMSTKVLNDLYMVYRIIEEMKARGIDFCPIDIYKAKRSDFQVINGKIMPSFDSIPGVGSKDEDMYDDSEQSEASTALKCELEGRKGEYSSIENFSKRTGVNKTVIEYMKSLGLFDGMKEDDQNTVFDYLGVG